MTAQVAIFTPSFAVLAADSAVTVSGSDEERVYNGVEKIVPLSATEPMAALIYGAASIARVPWGTVLHAFAAETELRGKSLSKVVAELAIFVQGCLRDHLDEYGAGERQAQAYAALAAVVREALELSEVEPADAENSVSLWLDEAEAVLLREVSWWSGQNLVLGVDEQREAKLHTEHRAWADECVESFFAGISGVSSALRQTAAQMLLLSATRCSPPGFRSARIGGVVITGFGTGRFWPGYCELLFDGVGLDGVRVWVGEVWEASGPVGARVRPFAQISGVKTLMDGMHPALRQIVGSSMVDAGLDENQARAALQQAEASWHERHTQRINETLAHMPAPALCEIAESLVAITALEHRLTGSLETVGGTISVGVMSPGEPLRWGKRPSLMAK